MSLNRSSACITLEEFFLCGRMRNDETAAWHVLPGCRFLLSGFSQSAARLAEFTQGRRAMSVKWTAAHVVCYNERRRKTTICHVSVRVVKGAVFTTILLRYTAVICRILRVLPDFDENVRGFPMRRNAALYGVLRRMVQ